MYEAFFGFSQRPFTAAPHAQRFFPAASIFTVKSSYLSRVMSDIIKAPKNPGPNQQGGAEGGMPLKLSGEAAKNFVFVEIINLRSGVPANRASRK